MKSIIIIFVFFLLECNEEKPSEQNRMATYQSNFTSIEKEDKINNLDKKYIIKFIDDYMKCIQYFNQVSKSKNINETKLLLGKLSSEFYSKEINIITIEQINSGSYLLSGEYKIKDIEFSKNEIILNLKLKVISKYDLKKKKVFDVSEEIDDKLVLILENSQLRIGTYFLKIIGIGIQ